MLVQNIRACVAMLRTSIQKMGGGLATAVKNPASSLQIDPVNTVFKIMDAAGKRTGRSMLVPTSAPKSKGHGIDFSA